MRCPGCDSTQFVKCGKRETKRGSRQQYHCNTCGKRFVDNPFRDIAIHTICKTKSCDELFVEKEIMF